MELLLSTDGIDVSLRLSPSLGVMEQPPANKEMCFSPGDLVHRALGWRNVIGRDWYLRQRVLRYGYVTGRSL